MEKLFFHIMIHTVLFGKPKGIKNLLEIDRSRSVLEILVIFKQLFQVI